MVFSRSSGWTILFDGKIPFEVDAATGFAKSGYESSLVSET